MKKGGEERESEEGEKPKRNVFLLPHLKQPIPLTSSVSTNRHIRSKLKLLEFCSEW